MTEAGWLACEDPVPMIVFLRAGTSDRKLRLFACACVRRFPLLIRDRRCREGVEAAERFADGSAGPEDLSAARHAAAGGHFSAGWRACHAEAGSAALRASLYAARGDADPAAKRAVRGVRRRGGAWEVPGVWVSTRDGVMTAARAAQARLLREVVGNPFRPVAADRLGPAATPLARAAYAGRAMPSGELDPHRLAVLADALEEAGAPDELATHLRSPGPHVRGCWATDLCLGLG